MRRCCRVLRRWDVRVYLDPVISHLSVHDLAGRFRDDYIGLFDGHVAVNAIARNLVSQRFGHATALPLMAGEAFQRIGFGGLSDSMDVVAGGATHLRRRAIAFATLKQSDLVSMDIRMLNIGRWELFEVLTQRPARKVREGWRQGFTLNPVVAFGTEINLPVARKLCWIQDV